MMCTSKFLIRKALWDAFVSALIAFVLFGPMTGLILQGFTIKFELIRPTVISIIVFCGRLLLIWGQTTQSHKKWWQKLSPSAAHQVIVKQSSHHIRKSLLLVFIIACTVPFVLSKYWLSVAILALIYVLLGLGLNIVVGLAGLLDLGFVAFYAVGAYGYALGAEYLGLGFWTAIPFCALLAASFGAILGFPVLRMHGDYLAIVTLGFGEIIRLVLNNWATFTHGPNGISTPSPTFLGLEFTRRAKQGGTTFHEYFGIDYSSSYKYMFIYFVLFILVCFILKFVSRLQRMPIGRAWEALREDEIACRSLGINHVTTKLSAFSMGAMIGGIGGVFFAAYQGFINPSSFTFIESAIILAIVVLGGMGSILGVVLAAIILTLLPEILREFAEYRMLGFGLLMVMMMIWRPRGLVRIIRQWIERPKMQTEDKKS
tara:strand:- start:71414 stop:72700 length:1287 start_codon:yes stop_codon:yes gene_type:complete